jgi:DNA invertase Pin-like site-specific DNA recombinase
MRAGLFRRFYVYSIDRLTRSGRRDTLDVVEELRCHGVDVISLSDGFSLDGSAAEITL